MSDITTIIANDAVNDNITVDMLNDVSNIIIATDLVNDILNNNIIITDNVTDTTIINDDILAINVKQYRHK